MSPRLKFLQDIACLHQNICVTKVGHTHRVISPTIDTSTGLVHQSVELQLNLFPHRPQNSLVRLTIEELIWFEAFDFESTVSQKDSKTTAIFFLTFQLLIAI